MTTYQFKKEELRAVKEPIIFKTIEGNFRKKGHSFLFVSPMNFLSYDGGGFVHNKREGLNTFKYYIANNEYTEKGQLLSESISYSDNMEEYLEDFSNNNQTGDIPNLVYNQATDKYVPTLATFWDGSTKEQSLTGNNLKLSEIIFSDNYNNGAGLSRILHPSLVRYNSGVPFSNLISSSYQQAGIGADQASVNLSINKASYELFKSVATKFLNTMNAIDGGQQDLQYIYVNQLLYQVTEAFNYYNTSGDLLNDIIFTYGIFLNVEGTKGVNAPNTDRYQLVNKSYVLSEEQLLEYVAKKQVLVKNKEYNKSKGIPYFVKTNLDNLSLLRYLLPTGGFTQVKMQVDGQDLYLPSTSTYSFKDILKHVFPASFRQKAQVANQYNQYEQRQIQQYAHQVNHAPQQAYPRNPMSQTQVYTQQVQYAPQQQVPQQPQPVQQPQAQQAYVPQYGATSNQQFPTQPPANAPPVNNPQNNGFVTPDSLTDVVGTAPVQNQYPTQEIQPLRGFEADTFTPQGSGDVPF
jgi:hypothetical protein